MGLPKGITERKQAYRARVSSGETKLSKDFNFKSFPTKEKALEAALLWLSTEKKALENNPNLGITSKFALKNKKELTQEILKQYLDYNAETGVFTWLKSEANHVNAGDVAGCSDDNGYRIIRLLGKTYKAHRLAFLYVEGELPEPSLDIDHKDRNPANNSWNNLRKATRSQNQFNKKALRSLSGIKGLAIVNNSYRCTIYVEGIAHRKFFKRTPEGYALAVSWLHKARQSLHKEFSNHG